MWLRHSPFSKWWRTINMLCMNTSCQALLSFLRSLKSVNKKRMLILQKKKKTPKKVNRNRHNWVSVGSGLRGFNVEPDWNFDLRIRKRSSVLTWTAQHSRTSGEWNPDQIKHTAQNGNRPSLLDFLFLI